MELEPALSPQDAKNYTPMHLQSRTKPKTNPVYSCFVFVFMQEWRPTASARVERTTLRAPSVPLESAHVSRLSGSATETTTVETIATRTDAVSLKTSF